MLKKWEAVFLVKAGLYECIRRKFGSVGFVFISLLASAIAARLASQMLITHLNFDMDTVRFISSMRVQYILMGGAILMESIDFLVFLAIKRHKRKLNAAPTLQLECKKLLGKLS